MRISDWSSDVCSSDRQDEGQGADDVGARLGFGRQGFDLQLQLASATQNVGEVGQRLREVAAGFRLNRQGNREEVELLDVEAAGAVPQRLLELGAQADRVGYPTQLYADRIDDLLSGIPDRLGDRQPARSEEHTSELPSLLRFSYAF